jgi:hypothetical protein
MRPTNLYLSILALLLLFGCPRPAALASCPAPADQVATSPYLVPTASRSPQIGQAPPQPSWAKRVAAKWLGKKVAKQLAKSDTRRTHWSSIASFVCGLFALVFFLFFFFSLFASAAAIVFGFVGLERSGKDREHKNRGLALAGLIMGVAAALLLGLFLLGGWFS